MMVLTLLAVLWGIGSPPAEDLEWKGRRHALDALPEELLESRAEAAVAFWVDWATRSGYRMILSGDTNVLLLWPAERRASPLKHVEKVIRRADEVFPLIERLPETSGGAGGGLPGFSPEELFGEDWRDPAVEERHPKETEAKGPPSWGDPSLPLDTDAAVVLQARNPDEYLSALEEIAASFPYLAEWVPTARESAGVVMERPLFAAVVENVQGNEEWSADHEIVHRLAQLLLVRRYGRPPNWVVLGVGWNVEYDLLKSIWCFPYRSEFVFERQHSGWAVELRNMFRDREDEPLRIFDLATCKREQFDEDCAALAWGTIRFLIQHYPESLSPFLERLRVQRGQLGKTYTTNASWRIEADYEVPRVVQEQALREAVRDDVLHLIADWFRDGKRWKKPKPIEGGR